MSGPRSTLEPRKSSAEALEHGHTLSRSIVYVRTLKMQGSLNVVQIWRYTLLALHQQKMISAPAPPIFVVIGGMVMPLGVRSKLAAVAHGEGVDEKHQMNRLFWTSSTICQMGRKPFMRDTTSPNHIF